MRARWLALTGILGTLTGVVGMAISKEVKSGAQVPITPQAMYPGEEVIDTERVKGDLGYICSDNLEGRNSGADSGRRAGNWLAQQMAWLGFQPAGTNGYFQPFTVSGRKMRNIVATIPGNGSNEIVLIGAHYDHVGDGYHPGTRDPRNRGKIHNGADDNGSGTTAVLQVARAFAQANKQYRRRVVIMWFDGEERGLLGSRHWVRNPSIAGKVVLAITMDMVGRIGNQKYGNGPLRYEQNGGSQLNNWFATAKQGINVQTRRVTTISSSSDHFSFHQARIPILYLFNGTHADWHMPDDDLDRINPVGLRDAARIAYRVAIQALEAGVNLTVKGPVHKVDMDSLPMGCGYHQRVEDVKPAAAPKRKTR